MEGVKAFDRNQIITSMSKAIEASMGQAVAFGYNLMASHTPILCSIAVASWETQEATLQSGDLCLPILWPAENATPLSFVIPPLRPL